MEGEIDPVGQLYDQIKGEARKAEAAGGEIAQSFEEKMIEMHEGIKEAERSGTSLTDEQEAWNIFLSEQEEEE